MTLPVHAVGVLRGPESERFAAGERLMAAAPVVALTVPVGFLLVSLLAAGSCNDIECASDRGAFAVLALVLGLPTFLPILYLPGDLPFGLLIGLGAITSVPLWVLVGRRVAERTVSGAGWDVPSWRAWWKGYVRIAVGWIAFASALWFLIA